MIETNNFCLSKKEYLNILLHQRIRKYRWLYLFCYLLGLLFLCGWPVNSIILRFYSILCFLTPFIEFYFLYRHTKSKDNSIFFIERRMILNNGKISFVNENISLLSEISFDFIIKKVVREKYYLLYLSKNSFFYVPKSAFKSFEDMNEFEQEFSIKSLL